jgi:hypothetical protein
MNVLTAGRNLWVTFQERDCFAKNARNDMCISPCNGMCNSTCNRNCNDAGIQKKTTGCGL